MVCVDTDAPPKMPPKSYTPAQILLSINAKKTSDKDTNEKTVEESREQILGPPHAVPSPDSERLKSSPSQKGVNLSELLTGNKNNKNKPKTFMVKLKVPPKQAHIVTLKFKDSGLLKNAVSKPKVHANSSPHPFFKEVFQRLKTKSDMKVFHNGDERDQPASIAQRSYTLPKPDRSSFKVRNLSPPEMLQLKSLYDHCQHLGLPLKTKIIIPDLSFSGIDFLLFYSLYKDISSSRESIHKGYVVTIDTEPNLNMQTITNSYRHLQFDERYNKFFDPQYCQSLAQDTVNQWCDLYRPHEHSRSLQKQYIANDVFNWLTTAFSNLKKVNQVKRKEKLTKKKSSSTKELDSFIVFSDHEETDHELDDFSTTVPSLIIEGPLGCGKTSMIHSIVDDELDGFVFEFNSSQSRARKEIDFHLKQIGTTSMVQRSKSYNNDKTVILFDDVDLIDDDDKEFWSGATDLLSYSYRPVVFITSDLKKIPTHIVDESTVYRFDKIPKNEIYQYLNMLALSRNLNIDSKVLNELSAMDLRKSLMQLQMFSYNFDLSNVGLTNVTVINDEDTTNVTEHESNLEQLNNIQYQMDLDYFTKAGKFSDDADSYIDEDLAGDLGIVEGRISDRYETDRNSCIEFYASKYFSNGSRSKACRYMDGDDYNKKHPANTFYSLSREKVALDLLGLVRAMAQREYTRAQNNYPRRFDLHPLDTFDLLHISSTTAL